ncbi:MAG TPA: ABC transporter permease [Candidatus Limnocylindrales bacterium]|nr:ABC transporter permease [Candidatus Limnocylindrales bacterium]
MSAPALPATMPRVARPSVRGRGDRLGSLVEIWFRAHSGLVYLFLYAPILVVVLFAFNDTEGAAARWEGFSTRWFGIALDDPVVRKSLTNSFIVAIPNAVLATAFGTMAALGLQRVGRRVRLGFDMLTYMSVIVPEIVIALATLVLFATGFDAIESATGIKLKFGYPTIIAAHVLFNTSLVLLLVRARLSGMDRTLAEASEDLFATPWRTFRQITFPLLLPAIVAGFLLSFTFSFDDYVITTFVSGPGSSTLPLFIFGQVRRGVTPETNAVATMILGFTLAMLLVGQIFLIWQARRAGRRGAGMAAVVGAEAEEPPAG